MAGRRLGRGLEFLLSDRPEQAADQEPAPPSPAEAGPGLVALDLLDPNPYQPRQTFRSEEIAGLAESIRESGVLQPLLVRRNGGRFQVVAGERRARAAKVAGLAEVPAIVRDDVDDVQMRLLALVENVQRTDLDPIEKALCFRDLHAKTGWTHDRIAKATGLERSSVSNYLRLLELEPQIRREIQQGRLTMGHARALLAAPSAHRLRLAETVVAGGLSVRETERLAKTADSPARRPGASSSKPGWATEMEQNLIAALGCPVRVGYRAGKGRIVLEVGDRADFDRVYELLMSTMPVERESDMVHRKLEAARSHEPRG